MTADDLRAAGYAVDDTTTPGTWVVDGIGRTWTFPADDAETARAVYGLALTARAEAVLAELDAALASWDSLDSAEVKAAVKRCIQVTANLARLTIRRYGS